LDTPPRDLADAVAKRSAVAMMLTPDRRVWFMRRSQRPGDPWSGHVSFPGGREEQEDDSLLVTAMRETAEEVGVPLGDAQLLGRLHDLRTRPVATLMIRPFVFALESEPDFRLNHEVVSIHTHDLDALLEGVGRTTMRWPRRVGMKMPCVDFDGVRLWGLTLSMVDDLLHRIDGRGEGLSRPMQG
jgi:8-oxo-dGTP pyrophosphatase MutT (NUDIX family)